MVFATASSESFNFCQAELFWADIIVELFTTQIYLEFGIFVWYGIRGSIYYGDAPIQRLVTFYEAFFVPLCNLGHVENNANKIKLL